MGRARKINSKTCSFGGLGAISAKPTDSHHARRFPVTNEIFYSNRQERLTAVHTEKASFPREMPLNQTWGRNLQTERAIPIPAVAVR